MQRPEFVGVTTEGLAILNKRLLQIGLPSITTLADLKARVIDGLFVKQRSDIGQKGRGSVITAEVQREFLKSTGASGQSLNLDSISKLNTEIVRVSTQIAKVDPRVEKPRAGANYDPEAKYVTTACGETFDPERCFAEGKSPYRMDEVQSFMERYNIYQPKGASYKSLCDLLRSHWKKFMTDALVDLFTKQKVTELTSTQLHELAIERGIQARGVPDAEIGRQLIRYMVDELLTVDALQFGLGEAAESIVDTIMNGSLDITSDAITSKQRLAILMIGARWNPKLLQFISVSDPNDTQLRMEFENFQQSLNNLRTAVTRLSEAQVVKTASQLASTIAKTAGKSAKVTAAVISENTEIPLATEGRSEDDTLHFIANMKFAFSPDSTFKIVADLFRQSGSLKKMTTGKYVILVPDDTFFREVVLKALKCDLQAFINAPSVGSMLELNVFKDLGPFKAGKLRSLTGKEWPLRRVKEGTGTFWAVDGKSYPEDEDQNIPISDDVLEHGNLKFYHLDGLLLTVLVRDKLIAEVKLSKQSRLPNKSVPAAQSQMGRLLSEAKELSRKMPSNLPHAKTVKEAREIIKEMRASTPVELDLSGLEDDNEMPPLEPTEVPSEEDEIATLIASGGTTYTSVNDMLYGKKGLLKNFKDAEPSRLTTVDLMNKKLTFPQAEALKRIAVVFAEQKRVNPNFDVQLDSRTNFNVNQIKDLLQMKISATPARVEEKTTAETLSELHDVSEIATLLKSKDLSGRYLFLPRNAELHAFMKHHNIDAKLLQDPDTLSFILDAHSTREEPIESGDIEMVDGTVRHVDLDQSTIDDIAFDSPIEALDGKIYVIQGVLETEEVLGQLGIDVNAISEEIPVENSESSQQVHTQTLADAPEADCERFEYLVAQSGLQPVTMSDVFESDLFKLPTGDLLTMTKSDFRDAYLAQLSSVFDFDELANVFTSAFAAFLRAVAIGYQSNPRASGLSFDCDNLGKLQIGGARKDITGADVPLQTPLVQENNEPAQMPLQEEASEELIPNYSEEIPQIPKEKEELESVPQLNALGRAIERDPGLSETFKWLGLTGLKENLMHPSELTVFAPTNKAWKLLYKIFKMDAEQFAEKYLAAATEVLQLHIVPGSMNLNDLIEIGRSDNFTLETLQGAQVPIGYSTTSAVGLTFGTADVEGSEITADGGLCSISAVQQTSALAKFKRREFPVSEPDGPPVVVADIGDEIPLGEDVGSEDEIRDGGMEEMPTIPASGGMEEVFEKFPGEPESPVELNQPISEEVNQMHDFIKSQENLSASYAALITSTQFDGLDVFNWSKDKLVTLFIPDNEAWVNADLSAHTESDDADVKVTILAEEHQEVLDRIVKHHIAEDSFSLPELIEKVDDGDHGIEMLDGHEEHLDTANDTIFFRENHLEMITESFQIGRSWVHVISTVLIPLEVQLEEAAEEEEQIAEAIAQSLAEEPVTLDLDGLDW